MKYESNFIAHYGVAGQQWGKRRYQNEDGSLTMEGRDHYGIMGIRESSSPDSYSRYEHPRIQEIQYRRPPPPKKTPVSENSDPNIEAEKEAKRKKVAKALTITGGILLTAAAGYGIYKLASSDKARDFMSRVTDTRPRDSRSSSDIEVPVREKYEPKHTKYTYRPGLNPKYPTMTSIGYSRYDGSGYNTDKNGFRNAGYTNNSAGYKSFSRSKPVPAPSMNPPKVSTGTSSRSSNHTSYKTSSPVTSNASSSNAKKKTGILSRLRGSSKDPIDKATKNLRKMQRKTRKQQKMMDKLDKQLLALNRSLG